MRQKVNCRINDAEFFLVVEYLVLAVKGADSHSSSVSRERIRFLDPANPYARFKLRFVNRTNPYMSDEMVNTLHSKFACSLGIRCVDCE